MPVQRWGRRLAVLAALVATLAVPGCGADERADGADTLAPAGDPPGDDAGTTDGGTGTGDTVAIELDLDEADTGTGSTVVRRVSGCPSEPGSPTDLDAEPATWLAFGTYLRWTDGEGCSVRIDVISHIQGATHCDYQAAEYLTIGRPLGASIDGAEPGQIARFVWDPTGVLPGGPWGETLPVDELPPGAVDTGYRRDLAELWLDGEAGALYRVVGDRAQAWHPDDTGLGLCS